MHRGRRAAIPGGLLPTCARLDRNLITGAMRRVHSARPPERTAVTGARETSLRPPSSRRVVSPALPLDAGGGHARPRRAAARSTIREISMSPTIRCLLAVSTVLLAARTGTAQTPSSDSIAVAGRWALEASIDGGRASLLRSAAAAPPSSSVRNGTSGAIASPTPPGPARTRANRPVTTPASCSGGDGTAAWEHFAPSPAWGSPAASVEPRTTAPSRNTGRLGRTARWVPPSSAIGT